MNVLSNAEDDGLAGLVSALESDTNQAGFLRVAACDQLGQGMNVALGLEQIANPAFIAGIAMRPFDTDAVADGGDVGIVHAPTLRPCLRSYSRTIPRLCSSAATWSMLPPRLARNAHCRSCYHAGIWLLRLQRVRPRRLGQRRSPLP